MDDIALSKDDIADLFTENYLLKKCLEKILSEAQSIRSRIVCIGGPLNDNVKRYTPDQLKDFWDINETAEYIVSEIEDRII